MKNEGIFDRVFHIVFGLALLSLLFLLHMHGGLKFWIGWLGFMVLYSN